VGKYHLRANVARKCIKNAEKYVTLAAFSKKNSFAIF